MALQLLAATTEPIFSRFSPAAALPSVQPAPTPAIVNGDTPLQATASMSPMTLTRTLSALPGR